MREAAPKGRSSPHLLRLIAAACACFGAAAGLRPAAVVAREPGAGRVVGTLTTKPTGRLPETIVYLESSDPAYRCDPSSKPVTISQKGAQFSPTLLAVPVGTTVAFLNDEETAVEHNVYSKSECKPFDLGLYRPGVSRAVTFDKPGPVHLLCSIHKNMSGTIFVSPTPYLATVGGDGRFAIENVPPGKYALRTWQRAARYLEAESVVEVRADQTTDAGLELKRGE